MVRTRATTGILVAAALGLGGCATICNSASNSAGDAIGNAIGKKVGNDVGNAVAAQYSPMFLNFYYGYIFSLAFSSHGYDIGNMPMKPGEWVTYEVKGHSSGESEAQKPAYIKRAYLFNDKDGNEYWQVKFTNEEGETMTLEAMFDKGRNKILRMRSKMPKDAQAAEVPVNDQTYYIPPQKLTKQSLAGARVGLESVTVPGGTFKAMHYKFGGPGGVNDEWWVVRTGVPGGVVQYRESAPQQQAEGSDKPEGAKNMDPNNWTESLKEHGTGAVSELDMKPVSDDADGAAAK